MTNRLLNKPPIGLKPKNIWEEEYEELLNNLQSEFDKRHTLLLMIRIEKIKECIAKYMEHNLPIQKEWLDEYHELIEKLPDTV